MYITFFCFKFEMIILLVSVCDIQILVKHYWWEYWALYYLSVWIIVIYDKGNSRSQICHFLCCWLFTKNSIWVSNSTAFWSIITIGFSYSEFNIRLIRLGIWNFFAFELTTKWFSVRSHNHYTKTPTLNG